LQSHTPIDQCDEQTLLREYHWKTAAYTFEGPILCGAILAGADSRTRDAISSFALSIGQAYQLQNDLLDLSRPVTEGSDMIEAKRTITLLRARALMSKRCRAGFDADLNIVQAADGRAIDTAESLRQRVLATGAIAATRTTLDTLLAQAHTATTDPVLPVRLASAMRNLLDSLNVTYFQLPVVTDKQSV
jgi:geranylgeranyl diphosphate synthase, type I